MGQLYPYEDAKVGLPNILYPLICDYGRQAADADTTGEDLPLNLVLNPVFDQIKHINFRKRKSDKSVSAMTE